MPARSAGAGGMPRALSLTTPHHPDQAGTMKPPQGQPFRPGSAMALASRQQRHGEHPANRPHRLPGNPCHPDRNGRGMAPAPALAKAIAPGPGPRPGENPPSWTTPPRRLRHGEHLSNPARHITDGLGRWPRNRQANSPQKRPFRFPADRSKLPLASHLSATNYHFTPFLPFSASQ